MRNTRTFWGVAILLLGALFLLQNLGIISINIWAIIWPLLIILLGIQILWGVILHRSGQDKKELSIPLTGVNDAFITFEHGAGQIDIKGGAPAGTLLAGEFYGGVRENISLSGTTSRINLRFPDEFFGYWPVGVGSRLTWNISLTPEIPLDLHLKSGASESVLDLTDLQVRSLRVDTGASSTRINTPARAGYTRLDVHSGAASVVINIPQGVVARIESKGGLATTNVDRIRFPQNGNIYQSPDYSAAANRIDIQVETGVGSVEIH